MKEFITPKSSVAALNPHLPASFTQHILCGIFERPELACEPRLPLQKKKKELQNSASKVPTLCLTFTAHLPESDNPVLLRSAKPCGSVDQRHLRVSVSTALLLWRLSHAASTSAHDYQHRTEHLLHLLSAVFLLMQPLLNSARLLLLLVFHSSPP